jgi:hypothetical protein
VSESLLYPNVIDGSTLGANFTSSVNLPISIEGEAGSDGSCVVDTEYTVRRPSDAVTYFGATSTLTQLLTFVLGRGVSPIYGIASAKGSSPNLTARQAAWSIQETNPNTRIRLTDATDVATFEGLATSCNNANLLYNKHFGMGGLPAGSSKATCISAAESINSERFVLVSPGVLDSNGTLWSGGYGAALAAALVANNPDISDDLNLELIANFAGIELNSVGQPLFLMRVVSGTVVNDFEDLLQAGVSPLQTNQAGQGLQITHLRMTYTGVTPETDYTYDALMTRLIVDQVFLDVRSYCLSNNFLQKGNTAANQAALAAGVANLLQARSNWISPITQSDGTLGYAVSVLPSSDMRSVYIQYQGTVIRGIAQIAVDAELTIPV